MICPRFGAEGINGLLANGCGRFMAGSRQGLLQRTDKCSANEATVPKAHFRFVRSSSDMRFASPSPFEDEVSSKEFGPSCSRAEFSGRYRMCGNCARTDDVHLPYMNSSQAMFACTIFIPL